MKKSQILKVVRANFVDGRCAGHRKFICWTLDYVYYGAPDDDRVKIRELKHWIQCELLPSYATLEDWMHDNHRATYEDMSGNAGRWLCWSELQRRDYNADNFRQLRILWLDWMIAHFKSIGE